MAAVNRAAAETEAAEMAVALGRSRACMVGRQGEMVAAAGLAAAEVAVAVAKGTFDQASSAGLVLVCTAG